MAKRKGNFTPKRELMKRIDYAFPPIMNATEASFYLWRHSDLERLEYLCKTVRAIKRSVEDGRIVYTKRTLDEYIEKLYNEAV
jgi:hypothetical protein